METNRDIFLPDEARIIELWEKYGTPEPVIAHSKAVYKRCLEILEKKFTLGTDREINRDYIKAAALLHDIVRQMSRHEEAGADILRREGYPELAEGVRRHSDFPEKDWQMPFALETAIVYLADKQMYRTERISIEERFERSKKRILQGGCTQEAILAHERKYKQAINIYTWIENL